MPGTLYLPVGETFRARAHVGQRREGLNKRGGGIVDKEMVEMFLAFTAGMTAIGCSTGIIITFIRRRSKQPLPPVEVTKRLDDVLERLARLENGIDATAVEVERISEAQRFTARVLAERSAAPSLSDRPRGYTTPH